MTAILVYLTVGSAGLLVLIYICIVGSFRGASAARMRLSLAMICFNIFVIATIYNAAIKEQKILDLENFDLLMYDANQAFKLGHTSQVASILQENFATPIAPRPDEWAVIYAKTETQLSGLGTSVSGSNNR